ncbi:MAG TPA: type II CAAX endopeptidase family protein [Bacillales bacterium]|nr:type II CAAX endopeptidase family protein [Bacillales bacterium]
MNPAMERFQRVRVRSLVFWFFVYLIVYFIAGLVLFNAEEPPYFSWFFYGYFIVWMIWKLKRNDIRFRELMGSVRTLQKWYLIPVIVVCLLVFSIGSVFVTFDLMSYWFPSYILQLLNQTEPSMGLVIGLVVAPIIEELLFRGVLLHRWTYKWGPRRAIVFSSLLFGVLHADIVGATVFAIVMCILYIRTGSLLVTMLCHVFNNFAATAMDWIPLFRWDGPITINRLHSLLPYGFILLVITIPILLMLLKKYSLPRQPIMPVTQNH